MAEYLRSSPYFTTEQTGIFLDVLKYRSFPSEKDDIRFRIKPAYDLRPDLLANDLYGDPGLWWVFSVRNPNTLKDPLWDFQVNTEIYIPKKTTLEKYLGL